MAFFLLIRGGMTSPATAGLGKIGEDLACEALERRGYAIIARRYRTRVGEIDIVARDGHTVVFVEVKARSTLDCGHPAESVTAWKQRRIITMARHYIATHRLRDTLLRFDVVSILGTAGDRPTIEVFPNAFDADT